ncbi:MAG: hypothetical protein RL603_1129 [Pseudomonadota bacterium]
MSARFALGTIDAALAVASDGILRSCARSILHADVNDPVRFGTDAQHQRRLYPATISTTHWRERRVDLIRAELRSRLWPYRGGDFATPFDIRIGVSAQIDSAGLSILLAAARAEGLRVLGFYDAAALSVAAVGLSGTVLVLEVGLHHVAATRVLADHLEARRRASAVRHGHGLLELHDAWMAMSRDALVRRNRYDPLYDASAEQRLEDTLLPAASEAARVGVAHLEIPTAHDVARISLTRDQFGASGAAVLRKITAVLREVRPPGRDLTLLAPEWVWELPGIAAAFTEFSACRWVSMPTGLSARFASSLDDDPESSDTVIFHRSVPLHRPIEEPHEAPRESVVDLRPKIAPTHVQHAGVALPLTLETDLPIGREPGEGGLRLPDDLAGVSRLHCSLRRDGQVVTLVDHSRYGTLVNGERVIDRLTVLAGDRIRIGDPGVELSLLAVGERDGAP